MNYGPQIIILLLALIWGSTWLGIKISLEYFPAFIAAGLRFLAAYLFLQILIFLQRKMYNLSRNQWRVMAILGLQQAVIYGLVFWGEQYIDSGISAVLFSTMPFFVLMFSVWMNPPAQIFLTHIIGIVLSMTGTVLIYDPDLTLQPDFAKGFTAILISAVISSFMVVYVKRHASDIPAVFNTTVQMGVAGVLLIISGLLTDNLIDIQWSWEGTMAIIYLGVIGSALAFALYMWVIKKVTPLSASVITLLTPLVALAIGWFALNERITFQMLCGSALVLLGVFFISTDSYPLRRINFQK